MSYIFMLFIRGYLLVYFYLYTVYLFYTYIIFEYLLIKISFSSMVNWLKYFNNTKVLLHIFIHYIYISIPAPKNILLICVLNTSNYVKW